MSQIKNQAQQLQNDVRGLIADLSHNKDMRIRESAHLSLITIGSDALPLLIEAMSNPDKWIRWEAAKTLAEMRNPVLAPVFARELENQDTDIRWLAAEGLLALGKKGLVSLLESLIEHPTSSWLQQGAHHVLNDLYSGKLHEGENRYTSLYEIDETLRQKIQPVLAELDSAEPYLKLPIVAKSALDYLKQTGY
jgi:hypothetical protein